MRKFLAIFSAFTLTLLSQGAFDKIEFTNIEPDELHLAGFTLEYDREIYIETLNDWGWFGSPDDAPKWFSGGFGKHGGD